MPMIRISSVDDKVRPGCPHPATLPAVFSEGAFTPEQLDRLRAEPSLVVERLPEPSGKQRGETRKAATDALKDTGE